MRPPRSAFRSARCDRGYFADAACFSKRSSSTRATSASRRRRRHTRRREGIGMSAHTAADIPCEHVIRSVWDYLDDEIDKDRKSADSAASRVVRPLSRSVHVRRAPSCERWVGCSTMSADVRASAPESSERSSSRVTRSTDRMPSEQTSMVCRDARVVMWPYLDRELTRARRVAVAAHLVGCPECRGQFAFNRAFLRTIRSSLRAPR